MSRLHLFLLAAVVFSFGFAQGAPGSSKKPNLMIILADDMGYGDMEHTGTTRLKTPHLNDLVAEGVFCSQGYVAAPVCSPSRAGLITGRDPRRFGYQGNLNMGPEGYATRPELLGLPPAEHTLGDQLKAAGYATGLIGKWHLGKGSGFHPNERGFDYFCGMLGGGHHYFPTRIENASIERNGESVTRYSSEYLTDFFTDEGIRWMEKHHESGEPWLLFMSYNAPHTPMHATPEDLELFKHIKNEKRRTYAAMMYALDRGVGRLRGWLKDHGEDRNTLIVFLSDNGGAADNGSWNGPLSSTKGTLKEGGVRVPMIWSWVDTLPAGGEYDAPASALDILPTFLAAAGAEVLPLSPPMSHEDKRNRKRSVARYGAYDGVNLLPSLKGDEAAPPRTLFWRLQGQSAVLDGADKLIRPPHRPAQFFRPAEDPGELRDLAPERGERFEALFRMLGEWESNLSTVPLWGSSPYWDGESSRLYDQRKVTDEPE